ncbi:glutamate--cysteine ligase [Spongisporangium articulatum]|uniref:Putative glutamate--cysteine ligase 2 n=1 Tax=Spongisporangium articulatum TaxID=3362603 RepID=A0ABW8AH90_9ACTN
MTLDDRRTVGVEEEFLVVDAAGRPVPRAPDIVADEERLEHELQQEQAETGSEPTTDLATLIADLAGQRTALARAAAEYQAHVAALGTSPVPVQPTTTPNPRYVRMMREYGLTAHQQLSCGCHVHVSISSRDEGVAAVNAIQPWLAPILALSANSPYWQGEDTGFASYRRQVWNRWPSAGPTTPFSGPDEYDAVIAAMIGSGVLLDRGMVYFDARLSARYPTLEIRVADVCPTPEDAGLVAALCRGLVESAPLLVTPLPITRIELLRGAAWRASYSGLSGDLVDPTSGKPAPAPAVLERLVATIAPALRRHGDLDAVEASLDRVLARGTGADLQRAAFARRGDLADVVQDAVARTTPSLS